MEDIITDQTENTFADIETPGELFDAIRTQFEDLNNMNIEADMTNFVDLMMIKLFNVGEDYNISEVYVKLTPDQRALTEALMSKLSEYIDIHVGVVFAEEINDPMLLLYQIYSTIVSGLPEFMLNLALSHHFFDESIVDFFKRDFVTDNMRKLSDGTVLDPDKAFDALTGGQKSVQTDGDVSDIVNRDDLFVKYLSDIIDGLESRDMSKIFEIAHDFAQSDQYEYLDDRMNTHFEYHLDAEQFARYLHKYIGVRDSIRNRPDLTKLSTRFFERLDDEAKRMV